MRNIAPPVRLLLPALAVILLSTASLPAHDPGFSSTHVTVGPASVTIEVAFNNSDVLGILPALDRDKNGRIQPHELARGRPLIENWVCRGTSLLLDGQSWTPRVESLQMAENEDVVMRLVALAKPGKTFEWQVALVNDLAHGHRQYVVVRVAGNQSLLAEALLHRGQTTLRIDSLAAPGPTSCMGILARFLVLGVEHILIGFDHILFLLGLLVVGTRMRTALWTITAFTVSHSMTLALASLNVVALPAGAVESVIALSIVWVGVQNLRSRPGERQAADGCARGRWRIAFLFGLVHGFGFASVLAELGLGEAGGGVLPRLAAFNFGVELGQILIAILVLPGFWWLHRRDRGRLLIRVLSCLIIAAGSFWLVERTLL